MISDNSFYHRSSSSFIAGETEAAFQDRVDHDDDAVEFDWDAGWKGHLLGSYYWGYVFTQIPGGWLAYRLGFKWVGERESQCQLCRPSQRRVF